MESPQSERREVRSFTSMHPIGSDLWREISTQMGRKHSLSAIASDSVNTPLTHINHRVTVNRHCMLPAQIKNPPLSRSAFSRQLWGAHRRYCCYFTSSVLAFQTATGTKVPSVFIATGMRWLRHSFQGYFHITITPYR